MSRNILIVDDEKSMREFLEILFSEDAYEIDTAENGKKALEKISRQSYDLIISDMQMPELNGLDLLKKVKTLSPSTEVLIMTAFATAETAVDAMKSGAADYITKPFKIDEIKILVHNIFEKVALKNENLALKRSKEGETGLGNLIGISRVMEELYSMIKKAAPNNINILLSGESGTGKELAAKAIHSFSDRSDKPFVAINCGAVPENLLESELFGHKKGAFTGAESNREGLFQIADRGTLFLDEIGEMPLSLQVKLLRVLQEREFRPVGDTLSRKTDVRIIAATNKDLELEVRENRFREDLFYRINVMHMRLPALRDRKEDIPLLVAHFIEKHSKRMGKKIKGVDSLIFKNLESYDFPGNVRELENLIERAVALENESLLSKSSFPSEITSKNLSPHKISPDIPPEGIDMEKVMEDMEKNLLEEALQKSGGVRTKAAKLLGISFRSLRYRLAKYGFGEEDGPL